MDTVEGIKGTKPCFLTMLFRNCKLMLMFLLEEQTQDEVNKVFDYLTEVLGIELFQKLFEVIITDNGHEFQDRWNLECDDNGESQYHQLCWWFVFALPGHIAFPPEGGLTNHSFSYWLPLKSGSFLLF